MDKNNKTIHFLNKEITTSSYALLNTNSSGKYSNDSGNRSRNSDKSDKIQSRITTTNLVNKLSISQLSPVYYLFIFVQIVTYSINSTHFTFYSIVKSIGFIPCLIIYFVFAFFEIIFIYFIVGYLDTSSKTNISALFHEDFSKASCIIQNIFFIFSILLSYSVPFILFKEIMKANRFIKMDFLFDCLIAGIFTIFVFLVYLIKINEITTTLSFICNIASLVLFLLFNFLYCSFQYRNILVLDSLDLNLVWESLIMLSSSFHLITIIYYNRLKLKQVQYKVAKQRDFLVYGFCLSSIYNLVFLFHPLFYEQDNLYEENKSKYFLSVLFEKNRSNKIIISLFSINIISQVLSSNYQFNRVSDVVFRNKKSEIKLIYFMFLVILMMYFTLVGILFDDPWKLIYFNNCTVGMIVNFLFPFMMIAKQRLTVVKFILLSLLFCITSITFSSGYHVIIDNIFLKK